MMQNCEILDGPNCLESWEFSELLIQKEQDLLRQQMNQVYAEEAELRWFLMQFYSDDDLL